MNIHDTPAEPAGKINQPCDQDLKHVLRDILRDHEDGLPAASHDYTVAKAVNDWIAMGLSGRDDDTVAKIRYLADTHIISEIGALKLKTPSGLRCRRVAS